MGRRKFASAMGERAVIVVGFDQVKGHTAIVGASIGASTGRENRRASLALEPPPSADRLALLARFLAGDPAGPGIDVELDGEAPGHIAPARGAIGYLIFDRPEPTMRGAFLTPTRGGAMAGYSRRF